jgi:hypothetical protein
MKTIQVRKIEEGISKFEQQATAIVGLQTDKAMMDLLHTGVDLEQELNEAAINREEMLRGVDAVVGAALLDARPAGNTADVDALLAEFASDSPQAAAAVGGGYAPAPLPVHAFAPAAAYAPAARAASPPRQLAAPAPAVAQGAAAYDE